ncbi:MAG: hypothetical protein EOM65_14765 [Synergistales bacterium]|nr:hypothetical protein [Synergistales bacterium]
MRWKAKTREPFPGENVWRRTVAFLFLPRMDSDGYWRWLEAARVIQRASEKAICMDVMAVPTGGWGWRLCSVEGRGEGSQGRPTILDWLVAEPVLLPGAPKA